MPRILRIHNRLIVGGPTLNVLYLTKYLAPEFETLLIVGEKEKHEKDASYLAKQMGIETVSVPDMGRSLHPYMDYKAFRQVKKIIKKFRPDIVHTHAAKPGAVGRVAASTLKVPAIVHTYHGHVFHSYFGQLKTNFIINTERWLAKKTDAIIAISEQQKKELTEEFKIADQDKFKIIPLGFELNKFHEQQEQKRKKCREEFNLKDDEIAIGIIGRLVPVKNHELFLQGINYVSKNSSKKIRAFIIGDGETRKQLEEMAIKMGIISTSSLTLTSWRSDIDIINAGLDIVALTSLNEGTPVSLIEAQAANKPVVSTRVGGIQDVVIENETALRSDVNDVPGFQKNLLALVENDELRNCLGKKGFNHVQQKYSVERLAADMASLYHRLLTKKHGQNAFLQKKK
jgi:glycosyltransferase involved in cell wall biosynthesis